MERVRKHEYKWRCGCCHTISTQSNLLTAPSPFDPDDILTGCPHCKSCQDFIALCDELGCELPTCTGWPTGNDADEWGGYRQTCHMHNKYEVIKP